MRTVGHAAKIKGLLNRCAHPWCFRRRRPVAAIPGASWMRCVVHGRGPRHDPKEPA